MLILVRQLLQQLVVYHLAMKHIPLKAAPICQSQDVTMNQDMQTQSVQIMPTFAIQVVNPTMTC